MEQHSPVFKGRASLAANAKYDQPLDLVPRSFVESRTGTLLIINDITPVNEGIVGSKEYVSDTIPANLALATCIANTNKVRVHFICEPASYAMSEEVTINGTKAVVKANQNNFRMYEGYVDLTLDTEVLDAEIKAVSSTGAEATVTARLLIGGPRILTGAFGVYPNSQTHLKQGDTIAISGTVANDATEIHVVKGGISANKVTLTLGAENSGGDGARSYSGSIQVASGDNGVATIVASNFLGTESDTPFQTAPAQIDQTYPTIANPTMTYPVGQGAAKDGDTVTVNCAITGADSYQYSTEGGFTVADPTVYAAAKDIVLGTGEAFNFNNQYFTVTATRASNGAVTTKRGEVFVANAAPEATITINNNPAYLRSSEAGNTYTVRISTNQPIEVIPTLTSSAGELANFVRRADNRYEATIKIKDSDPRGAQSFADLVVTGLTGAVQNTIKAGASFTISGFLVRDLTVPAFAQKVAIGTHAVNPAKINAFYKGADKLTYHADLADHAAGFSLVNEAGEFDANGNYLWISDSAFAGANTSGTLMLTVEEV